MIFAVSMQWHKQEGLRRSKGNWVKGFCGQADILPLPGDSVMGAVVADYLHHELKNVLSISRASAKGGR